MSRDLFVQNLPSGIRSTTEVPDDFVPDAIGERARLISTIKVVAPHADFTDPSWGLITKQNSYHIEVNLGSEEVVEGFAFHVAGGREADELIARILTALGLRALDTATDSGFFELAVPSPAP